MEQGNYDFNMVAFFVSRYSCCNYTRFNCSCWIFQRLCGRKALHKTENEAFGAGRKKVPEKKAEKTLYQKYSAYRTSAWPHYKITVMLKLLLRLLKKQPIKKKRTESHYNKALCCSCRTGMQSYSLDPHSDCCPYISFWKNGTCSKYSPADTPLFNDAGDGKSDGSLPSRHIEENK